MSSAPHSLKIGIDLAGFHGRAIRDVRRIVHLAATALSATPPESALRRLGARSPQYVFEPAPSTSEIQGLNEQYRPWILKAAFRELTEVIGELFEETFAVRCYWRLAGLQATAGRITAPTFSARSATRPQPSIA